MQETSGMWRVAERTLLKWSGSTHSERWIPAYNKTASERWSENLLRVTYVKTPMHSQMPAEDQGRTRWRKISSFYLKYFTPNQEGFQDATELSFGTMQSWRLNGERKLTWPYNFSWKPLKRLVHQDLTSRDFLPLQNYPSNEVRHLPYKSRASVSRVPHLKWGGGAMQDQN